MDYAPKQLSAHSTPFQTASSLRHPIWRPDDRRRDPTVLPIANGYLVFDRRCAADREWSAPHAWAVACACTRNVHPFAPARDVTSQGFASPGAVVCWGGRWVLPYQSDLAHPTHLCCSESHDVHTWHAPMGFLGDATALPWNTRRRAMRVARGRRRCDDADGHGRRRWDDQCLLTSPDGVHWALLPEQEHCRDRGGAGGQGH
jgi:hypothetical protein